jgi:hypothetical protein
MALLGIRNRLRARGIAISEQIRPAGGDAPSVWGIHDDIGNGRPSGCGYYRIVLPLDQLAAHGWDAGYRKTDLPDISRYRLIVTQSFKPEALEHWQGLRARHKLIFEIDDNVFHIDPRNWLAYGMYNRPGGLDAVRRAAGIADLVTVTTETLAEVMRDYTANVAVLPNCIPGWVTDTPRIPRPRPAVGWQGSYSHGGDISLVIEPVRRFLDRFAGWDLRLVGTDYRADFNAPADRMIYSYWTMIGADPHGFYTSMDYDIGLIPLRDNAFNQAKSPLKVLEHMARGIPVIASDMPVYREVITDGVNGFLIRDDREWLERMSELAADDRLRGKMSAAARESARAWTIERGWTKWAAAYTGLLRKLTRREPVRPGPRFAGRRARPRRVVVRAVRRHGHRAGDPRRSVGRRGKRRREPR